MKARLGQHFLKSKRFANACIEAAAIQKNEVVLEIGAGKGFLTQLLLDRAKKVYAVEKDFVLITYLQQRFADAIKSGSLELIYDDVRNKPWEKKLQSTPFVVVANIPYYITGLLLRLLLSSSSPPSRMTLVLQKEVAYRIARDTKNSLLSLSVLLFGTPKYVTTIPPLAFKPTPRVSSAILTIENISSVEQAVQQNFFLIIQRAFQHKRKTVLKKFVRNPAIQNCLSQCGVTKTTRAEEVPFDCWKLCAELDYKPIAEP